MDDIKKVLKKKKKTYRICLISLSTIKVCFLSFITITTKYIISSNYLIIK